MLKIIFAFWSFFFGALMGSFLNCLVLRWENKKSFVKGRSACPHCQHILSWFDLIPIFSFLILKAKCRYCQKKISFQYFLTEILTGLVFVAIFWKIAPVFIFSFGFWTWQIIFLWLIFSFLIVIFIFDLRNYIIPDKAIFPAIMIVFLYQILQAFWSAGLNWQAINHLYNPLISAFSVAGFFFLIWAISQGKWMGFGDVKLVFLIGLLLGFPLFLTGVWLAFFSGSLVGLFLILSKKKTLKSAVPFGPFLIFGAFVALLLAEQINYLYLNFFS